MLFTDLPSIFCIDLHVSFALSFVPHVIFKDDIPEI